ncbi:MAG: permease [Verrucomicrobiae bacterium]|nr:permease [Verrucomicrobiae bacterium]
MDWFQFHLNDFARAWISILFQGIPFLLAGTLLAAIVDAFLPPAVFARLIPRNRFLAVATSGLLGLLFPLCECGILPVLRRMLRKGLPVPCAVTYMLASPIVNVVVIGSTLVAFKNQGAEMMTVARVGLGYAVAVLVGWSLLRLPAAAILRPDLLGPVRRNLFAGGLPVRETDPSELPLSAKGRHVLHCVVTDFLDVLMYLVLGSAAAALLSTSFNQSLLLEWAGHPFVAIQLMMGVAVLLSLCSSSDAFVAAVFTTMPQSSRLAFLVFGPMFDLKLMFLYLFAFNRRFVLRLVITLYLLVSLGTLAIHYLRIL